VITSEGAHTLAGGRRMYRARTCFTSLGACSSAVAGWVGMAGRTKDNHARDDQSAHDSVPLAPIGVTRIGYGSTARP
jgi:hypothetical protein